MSYTRGCLTRRQFLKGTAATLLLPGISVTPGLNRTAQASGRPSALALAKGGDPYKITVEVVESLGGMASFIKRGQKVLLKPNIGWDRRVEQAANTHPEVVRALAEMSVEAGAVSVKILDRTCNDARRSYRTSGIQQMVENLDDSRIRLDYVKENRFRKVAIPEGKAVTAWPLYGEALDADVIINVPIAKHHSISKLTLGMKNLMGLMGGNRGSIHWGIGQKLADITSVLKPDLTVLDATRILVRNGPTGGRLEDVKVLNRVAASTDPVALDAYGATLFGFEPSDLTFVTAGYIMGLGEMDLSKVQIKGS